MITMTQECFSSPLTGGSPIISLLRSQRPNPTFLEDGTTSHNNSSSDLGLIITLKTTRLLARAAGWHRSQVLLCLEQPRRASVLTCTALSKGEPRSRSPCSPEAPKPRWGLVCACFSGSPWGQMAATSEIMCGHVALALKAQVGCGCLLLNLASPGDVEGLPSERQGVSMLFQSAQLTMEAPRPSTPCPPPSLKDFPPTFSRNLLTQTSAPQPPELGTLGLGQGKQWPCRPSTVPRDEEGTPVGVTLGSPLGLLCAYVPGGNPSGCLLFSSSTL